MNLLPPRNQRLSRLPQIPAATEEPVIEASVPTAIPDLITPIPEEGSSAPEPVAVDVAEIVQVAAENNIMLADPTGEPLSLATVEATETLTEGDPYFTSGGVVYNFTFADCDPVAGGAAALFFANSGRADIFRDPSPRSFGSS